MLISHRYKFIFIKTRKTGGTSLEVDLSKLMADDDIVTPILPAEGGHVARNYDGYFNHMNGKGVRKRIGKKIYNSYYKFCVEREPVDKCISLFSMQKNSAHHEGKATDWSDFVARGDFPLDSLKYTGMFGVSMVDRILRYEELNAQLMQLMGELEVPFEGLRSKAKSGMREQVLPTDEECAQIYRAFRASNKHTGYRLEDRLAQNASARDKL